MFLTGMADGVTRYILQNWSFINREQFQFDFVVRDMNTFAFLEKEGCELFQFTCKAAEDQVTFVKEVCDILANGYDAVHIHTSFWTGFLIEEIAMQKGIPIVIVHAHSSMVDFVNNKKRDKLINEHERWKLKFSEKKATHFCACSLPAASWLFGEQISANKIGILHNAIDLNKYKFDQLIRDYYRNKLGLKGYFVMGNVGRFAYQKNHEFLIDIFREVVKMKKDCRLLLIGEGELSDSVKSKVAYYGIEDSVMFLGKRSDIPQILQAMDLFLLPSLFEGLPIVLVEAQAAGLKCLVSDMVTTEVKLTDNVTFLNLDLSEWKSEISKVFDGYERKNYIESMAAKGYDIEVEVKKLERMYKGMQ